MKKRKTLLNESTMRRFAKLANIPAIGATLKEAEDASEEEETLEEGEHDDAPDLDDPEDVPMDLDPDMGEPDMGEPDMDLEDEPDMGEEPSGMVKGEVAVMDLVDAIADAITDATGVAVQATEADLDAEPDMGELDMDEEPPLDMAPEMGPGEDEEMMAENYIRQKVRQALLAETKQPSKLDQQVKHVYNERMQHIAQKVYNEARQHVMQEAKTNAFSDEVQRRVLSRILKDTKK